MIRHFDTQMELLDFVESCEDYLTIRGGNAYNDDGELVAKVGEID